LLITKRPEKRYWMRLQRGENLGRNQKWEGGEAQEERRGKREKERRGELSRVPSLWWWSTTII